MASSSSSSSLEEEGATSSGFQDLTEDSISCILSFLAPPDISVCTQVNRNLRKICREDRKVWLPMCERRWGSCTGITQWAGAGPASYKLLYMTLCKWENVIGFWRGVGHGGWGSLTVFEWGPCHIRGFKLIPVPAHGVRKLPFLWMGMSGEGRPVSLIDPSAFKSIENLPIIREKEPILAAGQSSNPELLPADVHFVGLTHLVVEESQPSIPSPQLKNPIAEAAAAVASFTPEFRRSPSPCGSDSDGCLGSSPPGSFQYEMYHFLAGKVSSPGGDRAAWKQRRRHRERAANQGRKCLLEPQHFVKIAHCCPTIARPLQGLWKGIFDSTGLDFILVSYDEQDGIICRRVCELSGVPKNGSVFWTGRSSSRIGSPLPPEEEAVYAHRMHIKALGPLTSNGVRVVVSEPNELAGEEVVAMFRTSSCDVNSGLFENGGEGRVWQYASGGFGYGSPNTNYIIDFQRLLSSKGFLLDIVE